MSAERYNRWQARAIAQLSVAAALISGLSVAGLGVGLTLVRDNDFMKELPLRWAFASSMGLLFCSALFSCSIIIMRALDFRLTARKVRKDRNPNDDRPLTIFWLGAEAYGRLSWGLFWLSWLLFAAGSVLLIVSVGARYKSFLF